MITAALMMLQLSVVPVQAAPAPDAEIASVNRVLDAMHAAASAADGDAYFGTYTADGRFIGTDATERWSLPEFRAYAMPYFSQGALPEREAHPGAFYAFEALMGAFVMPEVWPAIFVRFEAGLLEVLGFGLDLSRCAATGSMDDLIYVSPRTGRAVSRDAGAPYADKLLNLPPFMLGAQAGLGEGDVKAGLDLTGHFLEQFVFHALNKPLPPARVWMIERLAEAGRL